MNGVKSTLAGYLTDVVFVHEIRVQKLTAHNLKNHINQMIQKSIGVSYKIRSMYSPETLTH